MSTKRLTRLVAVAGALVALGAGCGDDDTTDRSPGGTTVQTPQGDTQTQTSADNTTTDDPTQGSGRTTPTDVRTDTDGGDDDYGDDD